MALVVKGAVGRRLDVEETLRRAVKLVIEPIFEADL
jgi:hypothetical protein